MKIKKKLNWKDDWIEKSEMPMAEMFYRIFHRPPNKHEFMRFILIFVMTKDKLTIKREWKEFCEDITPNE